MGTYDMHGNVWEWCQDNWYDSYINSPIDGSAWTRQSSETRMLRGGSWYSYPDYCRSAFRYYDNFVFNHFVGFRVVCAGLTLPGLKTRGFLIE
ncbi:formylglycine-generating enzyme family protein [Dolichospermum sp. ST_sed4]|nr:formylglycine-generating enzyme family protein [Dolichospermum sp. ST_sed4]